MTSEKSYPTNSPFGFLNSILKVEGSDLLYLLVYSGATGILSLIVPIGVQSLVTIVSFGTLTQPVFFLVLAVFGCLMFAGILRYAQTLWIETLQRRIFVKIGLESALNLSKSGRINPAKVNQFFEVFTIQKSAQSLLIEGSGILLSGIMGMTLLAFYHPFLLAFDIFLAFALIVVIFVLGRGAISSAILESKRKHQVVLQLELIGVENPTNSENSSGLSKTNHAMEAYISARSSHFKILLKQIVGSYLVQAVASAALLGIGAVLVTKGQLTLGQLVAAELVVSGILSSLTKFQKHLETFYDLVAGCEKIEHLLEYEEAKEPPTYMNLEITRIEDKHSKSNLSKVASSYRLKKNSRKIAVGFFVFLGLSAILPWQQAVTGKGRVIAFSPNERPQEISASVEGRINKWHVHEGSKVKKGDPIVDLSDNDPEILLRMQQERTALAKRVSASKAAVDTAKLNLDRQENLYKRGLSARKDYERASLETSRLEIDEANAAAELARMDVRLSRQLTQSVFAPVDGTILRVIPGQGSHIVKIGEPIATLVPDTSQRAAEIWIHGNDLPLISEGQEVRLQFEGWPAIQFSGMPAAAVGTFVGKVQLIDSMDDGSGKFRLLVVPSPADAWPDIKYLRQGVRASGFVLIGKVTLIYELWRRFNAFPPQLPEATKIKQNSLNKISESNLEKK